MSFLVINIASVSKSWSEVFEFSGGWLRVAQCVDLHEALVFHGGHCAEGRDQSG